ncbi:MULTISPECIES: ABC transporter substrate-binding protein [Rhodococcus]|uniref:ABC transporter substrate-binding protein n=1 Tax=Rhodococcus TaxID=1827 RepID=UPI0011FE0DDB|nr:ABC transporter substrate-binding protein [Rhodococcus sp. (in: high G+C Gram-positive bacteria)]RZL23325.1 MAG: ABC transporter substrate-binding protein [Rhodococcus sp. (in: high G+C Gram-positive bacteria)]
MKRALSAAFVALALLLTSCGGNSLDTAEGETVTVTGKFGEAQVPLGAERVLPLSPQDADMVISMGVAPIALPTDTNILVSTNGVGAWPWQVDALADMGYQVLPPNPGGGVDALLSAGDKEIPTLLFEGDPQSYVEQIVALDPDVIVATGQWSLNERAYEQLSSIAPVVHFDEQANVEPWQDSTRKIGKALGREDEAQAAVGSAEADLAAVRAAHPEFEGVNFNAVIGDLNGQLYILAGEDRGIGMLMKDLGFQLTDWAQTVPTDADGRGVISYEYVAQLDTDIAVVISPAGDIDYMRDNEQWRNLSAVQRGSVVSIARNSGVPNALGFPSPISLPWGADRITNALSTAVSRAS